jgi:hypothetical protein
LSLATCGISSTERLCDHHECDRSREEEEVGDKHELEQLLSFTKVHTAFETFRVNAHQITWNNVHIT